MKKHVLLYFMLLAGASVLGQSVPNGGFENWTSAIYDYPDYYPFTSSRQSYFKCNTLNSCVKTTDAYHGTYAVEVTTTISGTDSCMGFFINANANGNPASWSGGIPYSQTPTGMRGYYKSAIMPGDSGGVLAMFRNNGNMIGFYTHKFYGTQSSYTPFSFTFSPPLPMAPDSVIIAGIASDAFNNFSVNGSMLKLDSISFTGVASQPALMNGDFELWQSSTLYDPDNWYIGNGEGQGVNRTTDAYAGAYAMELQTFPGDNNGIPGARAAQVSTGWWDNSCNCQRGGYPFSTQVDTLAFWYKYIPSGNDSALVNLTFKLNGNIVSGANKSISTVTGTYVYAELPFNIGSAIDTVIVQLQSSSWNDTLLSFVGSNFKVDGVHFKSQPLGINHPALSSTQQGFTYPNPVNDVLHIVADKNSSAESRLVIYDVTGRVVREETLRSTRNIYQLNVSDLQPGIYISELNGAGKIWNRFVKE